MTAATRKHQPAYGNWVRPRSAGIGPLGMASTGALLLGVVLALLVSMIFSGVAALVTAAVFAVPIVLASVPVSGRSLGAALVIRVGWWRRRGRRAHQYRTGMLSNLPSGRGRPLPGVLASTRLLEVIDGYDRSVGVIHRPGQHHYTVVLRCLADGAGLVEPEIVDTWVAGYGGFLAALGQEPGLRSASVIVDTAPDTGTWLASEHERTLAADAPELARAVMAEVVERYPAAGSENTIYVALTYAGSGLHRKPRDSRAVMTELARRLPGLIGALEQAGAGTVEPVAAAELPALIRVAFDPGAHQQLSAAAAAGAPVDLGWSEAGPVAAEESWSAYRHDGATSVTWEMLEAPRGTVFFDVLAALLAPHPDFVRKRVALLYRPHDPAAAATITQRDANAVTFTARNPGGRVSAMAERNVEATKQSEHEIAAGAGLTRFALMVTATVTSAEDLPQAIATIDRLGRISRLSLRRSYGSQAAAFALTLPAGFVPWEHALIPPTVREFL